MRRYKRDLRGYGPTPPDPTWPGGAKLALQIVLNFEEGGERCLLHGDAGSEAFLSEIIGADHWHGQRHANMESLYEYGARVGFWRLYEMLKTLPITVFGVATALARAPEAVAAMSQAQWEIACHGLKWIEYKDHTRADEGADMQAAIELHRAVTGARPLGWYTGRSSLNTLEIVASEGGFSYGADSYADDLPYWQRFGEKNQLIVPYTLDANDMRFATAQGFNSGEQFYSYLCDSLDTLSAEGRAGAPKMMSIGLHCRLAGRPGRANALKRFLDYAQSQDDIWFATRLEIAEHWHKYHPPCPRERPSEMTRERFVELFGDVFEHSPWVAERAHRLELGQAHDCTAGVHNAMARAFREAPKEMRLKVLKAHPDLAGKLAAAGRLSEDSSSEQISVGLDMLTDKERASFNTLNTAYSEKFDFPFIIAVRDHNKSAILKAFETRLKHNVEQEFFEACRQVERIAEWRLKEKLDP